MASDPSRKPGTDGPIVYLNDEGVIDDVLGRVEAAGGQVTREQMSIGDFGNIALFQDTEGNVVGLHSNS